MRTVLSQAQAALERRFGLEPVVVANAALKTGFVVFGIGIAGFLFAYLTTLNGDPLESVIALVLVAGGVMLLSCIAIPLTVFAALKSRDYSSVKATTALTLANAIFLLSTSIHLFVLYPLLMAVHCGLVRWVVISPTTGDRGRRLLCLLAAHLAGVATGLLVAPIVQLLSS